MHYEYLFWSMAAMVAAALAGGALCGRLRTPGRVLAGVVVLAAAVCAVVVALSRSAGFGDQAAMLAVAAFMFSLVIGTAAALLTRRILRRH
ncbi:hypothetical protein [Achromobacter xylosoxidans]|uniref:hypothetical protein n=1 Tax=Alcaligenes xylosoxydans xylosoxydans TaxID=85698 RepID=UPI001F13EC78|nr:hypothetical protein [Achromobacter xylosoxidans]